MGLGESAVDEDDLAVHPAGGASEECDGLCDALGDAWFAANGGRIDLGETMLLGTFVVLILVQLMMLGAYWRLPFTLGFWAFTFNAASSGTFAVNWLALWGGPGHELWAWLAIGLVTLLIGSIAARSAALLAARNRTGAPSVAPSAQLL